MSNPNQDALLENIAYMKTMAEAGARPPAVNGAALFWAGLIFGGAAGVHYAAISGLLALPNPWFLSVIWLCAMVMYGIAMVFIIGDARRKYGPRNAMNRAIDSVWGAVGCAIFALFICLIAVGSRLEALEVLTALIAPMILILYGIGWWVAAVVSCQNWLKLVCLGCFVAAPVTGLLAGDVDQILAYAIALTLFATIPGLILMRMEKA